LKSDEWRGRGNDMQMKRKGEGEERGGRREGGRRREDKKRTRNGNEWRGRLHKMKTKSPDKRRER
jgi:hypothetical protein